MKHVSRNKIILVRLTISAWIVTSE